MLLKLRGTEQQDNRLAEKIKSDLLLKLGSKGININTVDVDLRSNSISVSLSIREN